MFMAWKASSILLVESMSRPYCFEGNGPRSSNSLVAEARRLSRRNTGFGVSESGHENGWIKLTVSLKGKLFLQIHVWKVRFSFRKS